jgi:hypothetical protein
MGKTLLEDTTGFNPLTKAANALEERWHNEGVTKGIQHKAVLGLFRHLGSPEGMFTFMPTGMAHQLKPTDPMVKEIIGKLDALTSVSPKLSPTQLSMAKDIALETKALMGKTGVYRHTRKPPRELSSEYSAKYKDRPRKYLEDMLRWRNETLEAATEVPVAEAQRRMDDLINRFIELEATPRTPHMGKVRGAESFLEKQILKAMEEYRRLGTTGPGTATSTGFSFQRLMDLIR